MTRTHLRLGRRAPLTVVAAAAVLLLAACAAATPTPAASTDGGDTARCSLTPDVDPAATVAISLSQFGDEVTISAGEAVEFSNEDSIGHTVTEGTGGAATADACVDESLAGGNSLVVTFDEAGDYQITCTVHPSMQTVVHVE